MTNEKSSRFADWLVDGLIVLLIIVVVVATALVAAFAGSAFADVDTSGTTRELPGLVARDNATVNR